MSVEVLRGFETQKGKQKSKAVIGFQAEDNRWENKDRVLPSVLKILAIAFLSSGMPEEG